MADSIKDYAIGTLTIALLLTYAVIVAPNATHICRDSMITKNCNHLSGTGLTCYPYSTSRIGKKYCSTGWEEILTEHAQSTPSSGNIGAVWKCPVGAPCYQIK